MGMLYKRGKVFWIKYYSAGRPIRESTGTTKQKEAERFLKDREGKTAMGATALPNIEKIRFAEAAEALIQHYAVTGTRNVKEAESKLAPVRRFFDAYRLVNITQGAILSYQEHRQGQGLSNASINRECSLVRTALRLAYDRGQLHRTPRIRMLKESSPRSGFFEQKDFELVLQQLKHRPDLECAVRLGFTLGWRVQSEILTLKLSQVDLAAGTISLLPGTTKNRDPRIAYLTPELIGTLEEQISRVKALSRSLGRVIIHLFPHLEKGRFQGLPLRVFKKAWQNATKRAGLPNMLVHDLRRTAVRNLIRSGIPQVVAMRITGHRSLSVFNRYNITSDADLREAARKLHGHNLGTVAPLSASTASLSPRTYNSST